MVSVQGRLPNTPVSFSQRGTRCELTSPQRHLMLFTPSGMSTPTPTPPQGTPTATLRTQHPLCTCARHFLLPPVPLARWGHLLNPAKL